ncbi:MAG: DNA-binding protein WhiA [Bacilli bacterium]
MSFASEVKKELAAIKVDNCCLSAELHQIIRLRSSLILNNKNFKIALTTTSLATSRRIIYLIKTVYGVNVEMLKKERSSLDKKALYYIQIEDKGIEILKDLELIDDNYNFKNTIPNKYLAKECCSASLVRASFLIKGSVNDPRTSNYHLEITLSNEEEASKIQIVLEKVGIKSNTIQRKKGLVLYIKKAEHIGDFLGFIGAMNSRFAFEDFRIKKDLSNYVNRIINCDVSNEQKVLSSAKKQIEDIELIEKNMGFLSLSPRLMNAIILRTTNPEDSLSQLSEKSIEVVGKYISKSGLSHCFRDLNSIAMEIKNKL